MIMMKCVRIIALWRSQILFSTIFQKANGKIKLGTRVMLTFRLAYKTTLSLHHIHRSTSNQTLLT